MTVKTQRPMTFTNECGCIVDYDLLAKAMLWYATKPQCGKKHIFMYGRYPSVSILGEKIHVHRLLVLYANKNTIVSRLVSHHKDGNRLNCTIGNLCLLTAEEHGHLHNAGKTLTEEHKRKIALANRRRKGMSMAKRVHINLDELRSCLRGGYSINACAKHFGCDWTTIKSRIHQHPELLKGGE